MSYLALARKWRPKRFQEVVGQGHVLTALENALSQNRLHHAYLFSGTRGVGKTTIGRLFAKGLNCETGITATPCGECQSCVEIDQGRFVDLLEIDAASRTKVEDTRDLLDNVQYKPARGRFKVYLIDEVHMLSKHSFNALLKTLEEPPEYVKFLLATTDPQKLPVTILSRCLQFHLKPITVDDIHAQLAHVLTQESVSYEDRALGMLSHAADGSMRDALSLTDQAIALGNGGVLSEQVSGMLGALDSEQALYLLDAVVKKQADASLTALEQLALNGVSWDGLLQELALQLHRIALYQALPATLEPGHLDSERIQHLAEKIAPQEVQLYYQIALKGREELALAPTERAGAEMTLLRMLAFAPASGANATANVISTDSAAGPVATPESRPVSPGTAQSPAIPATNVPDAIPVVDAHPMPEKPSPVARARHIIEPAEMPPEMPVMPQSMDHMPSQEQQTYPENMSAPTAQRVPVAPEAPAPEAPAPEAAAPGLGLRHQLRSKRINKAQQPAKAPAAKKSEAAPVKKQSVLQRVTQNHPPVAPSEPVLQQDTQNKDNAYQWQASQTAQTQPEPQSLTPAQIKQALQHEKSPEMTETLLQESIAADKWSALIAQLDTGKLVEQLALNSSMEQTDQAVVLHLRPTQQHLNSERSRNELADAIARVTGAHKVVQVNIDETGQTPLELRDQLYQGKLQQAMMTIESDEHVRFIETRFAATLDRDSVRPL